MIYLCKLSFGIGGERRIAAIAPPGSQNKAGGPRFRDGHHNEEDTMDLNTDTVENFLNRHTQALLSDLQPPQKKASLQIPLITLCMQPGSGGVPVARRVADRLDFGMFHTEILLPMSRTADVAPDVLNAMEKHRLSGFSDFIASVLNREYLHPDDYLRTLTDIIDILSKVGKAVIVGRGANFVLPPEKRFAVRVIAPLEVRIKNVAFAFGVSLREAEKRIKNRAAKRRAFVREHFHKDIEDPMAYDLIVNTGRLDIESAAEMIIGTIIGSQVNHPFDKSESYILRKQH